MGRLWKRGGERQEVFQSPAPFLLHTVSGHSRGPEDLHILNDFPRLSFPSTLRTMAHGGCLTAKRLVWFSAKNETLRGVGWERGEIRLLELSAHYKPG